ncbi:MAG: efflux RND transporter periplasmic adaptor subunit [Candidatus Eremiobacteraeota bacterium]|nr:efflux RND transporter periplasmic adaptor subunit [Candidatus Eremiobacteraeota bacterium]MCW5872096.1 efflux RND transporter periplasmic adaptor subunit [Candidatus Eremiobacteraeota bacterium]
MKSWWWLPILLAGCSSVPPAESSSPAPESAPVVLAPVTRRQVSGSLRLTGQVRATEAGSVILTAPLDGVAVSALVKVGSSVAPDQPLVEMNSVYGLTSLQILERLEKEQDDVVEARGRLSEALTRETEAQTSLGQARAKVASLRADLRQAEAELQFARSDVRRKQELVEDGITSRAELEEARTRLAKAEAVRQAAEQELSIARGQLPLFQRNIGQFRQAVRLAQESVELSESNYQRNRAVLSQSQLVGTDLPADLTSLSLAGSKPAGAAQASTFFVRAPIAGVVTRLSVTRGQRLQSGAEIGQVQELSRVYVDANAFEADVAALRPGMPLQVISNGKTYRGRLDYIGRQVDPQTRAIAVRSLIHNPEGGLRPDTFVEVNIALPGGPGLTVPKQALLSLGNQKFVLVEASPGHYVRRTVRAGIESGAEVQIIEGLKEGEKVVSQGGLLLEAGEE